MIHWFFHTFSFIIILFLISIIFVLSIDWLTGCWVRRVYQIFWYKITMASGGCFILVDIDNLKYVNTNYGYEGGDEVIRGIGKVLRRLSYHKATRLGGDEFIIFLPFCKLSDARTMAEAVKREVEEQVYLKKGREIVHKATVTITVGKNEEQCKIEMMRAKESSERKSGVNVIPEKGE